MTKIGEYNLLTLLGKGRGGQVWSALDKDGAVVALKIFNAGVAARPEYDRGRELSHPNILSPLSFSTIGDVSVMAMPMCEGRSVDNAAGYFSEEAAWKLMLDIGSALAYLHSLGSCHGDVKPSNILREGNEFLLADFGAGFGGDLSSYVFAAPEPVRTALSDIWSLGASVFNLVMGSQVFNGLGGRAQKKDSDLPFMRKSMPELSGLVMRCLSFDSSVRPFAAEIVRLAEENLKRV
ncbi:MAG: protein kinase, partial [Bacteroidales bacterium]|nr:protein kinase [Bacteroidales bacterium]